MAALYDGVPAGLDELAGWIEHARPAALPPEQVDGLDRGTRDRRTAERNVLLSLDRLAAAPLVTERREAGTLDLHGRTGEAARRLLQEFVRDAHVRGLRRVRIVPGKGLRSGPAGPVLPLVVHRTLRTLYEVESFEMAAAAVAELDFINAKAIFHQRFSCSIPEIDSTAALELTEARHIRRHPLP